MANIAFAQTFSKVANDPVTGPLINKIMDVIVNPLLGILMVFTLLVFVWGLFGLISKGDDPTARKEGQQHMLWGVIGIFIIVSVYGIIRLIANTVGAQDPFL